MRNARLGRVLGRAIEGDLMKSYLVLLTLLMLSGIADAQTCGNGIREGAEQCDDGNRASLDGCSARCTFEQTQRVNLLKVIFTTTAACPNNAFGSAFTSLLQGTLQNAVDASVTDGSTSVLLYFRVLDDLTGSTSANVQLGLLNAAPQSPTAIYNGNSDVDWWYAIDDTEIDAAQEPLYPLTGSITSNVLNAGPGSFTLKTNVGAALALSASALRIAITTGTSTTPMMYVSGTDRGHLPSENLDPGLVSFANSGSSAAANRGYFCGNVSAASLAAAQIPPQLLAGAGSMACTQAYTSANTFLDLLVGGCTVSILQAVIPTQPDQVDAGAPPAGAGGPYKLFANASKVVSTCKDKNNTTVDLTTCLDAAAYSFDFAFNTDRVIAKSPSAGDIIFYDGFQ